LGKSELWVSRFLVTAPIRHEEKIPMGISARAIAPTIKLGKQERRQIIAKVEKEEIPVSKVDEYVEIVKEAEESPEVKKAILESPRRMTPVVVKQILGLPKEKQAPAVRQVRSLRLDEPEAIAHIQSIKTELPLPPPEDLRKVKERYESLQKEIKAKLETPEARERGELFRNWTGHIAVVGALSSLSCPTCGSKEIGWLCHDLDIKEALKRAEAKYKELIKK